MISLKSLTKKTSVAIVAVYTVTMSSCSLISKDDTRDNNSSHASSSPMSEDAKTPDAPHIALPDMESFTVDKKLAQKLSHAGDNVSEQWFIDQAKKVGVDKPDKILIGLRNAVCREIKKDTTISQLVVKVLDPYDLTETQQGAIISSALLSQCPDKAVMVPKGSTTK